MSCTIIESSLVVKNKVIISEKSINKTLCPPATAIVNDQDGNELARKDIASGATWIIVFNTSEIPLYAYNYGALNTCQDVSYAVGDDKWVRDNVFNPEIASWPTNKPWIFPILDPNDTTKLLRGATPEGTNIFGNLERFTDTLGTQLYVDGLVIDHYTGMYVNKTYILTKYEGWVNSINAANVITIGGKSGFHLPNVREYESLMQRHKSHAMGYSPFNYNNSPSNSNSAISITPYTSTSRFDGSSAYVFVNWFTSLAEINNTSFIQARSKTVYTKSLGFVLKKAFTYEPNTDTTKLILS